MHSYVWLYEETQQKYQNSDSIGTAQMEQEIQKRVLQIANGQQSRLEEQTGIQSAYDEGELKSYLAEVLEEIAESKKSK